MGTEKTKWRELGLTPRQLSKQMGVSCSMAEFIAQSYRVPLDVKGPRVACARPPHRQKTSRKKNAYTCNLAPRCDPAVLASASCSRKRRSEEELSDCDDSSEVCVWSETTKEHVSRDPSCSDPQSNTCSKYNCCGISTSAHCGCPSGGKRYKAAPRRKPRCLKKRRKPKLRRKRPAREKCRKRAKCPKKQRMVPINLCLEIPLNIFVDEEDGITLDTETQLCANCRAQCPADQGTPLLQHCIPEPMRNECEEPTPGHSAQQQQEEEDECPEETDTEDCAMNEDCRSLKDNCYPKAVAKKSCQLSWWEKFQDCVAYLESFLSSLVNKC